VVLQSDCFMKMMSRTAINGDQITPGSWSITQETKPDRTREQTSKGMPGLSWTYGMCFWACQLAVWSSWTSDLDKIVLGLSEVDTGFKFCESSFLGVRKLWEGWSLQPGAYEWRNHEGACNYHIHPSAIQIQVISERTSKKGNHSSNQAS